MKWFTSEHRQRGLKTAGKVSARLPEILLSAQKAAQVLLLGQHGRRRAGSGDHFWQYRTYDPLAGAASRIDWRRSAQGDNLYVREREEERPKTAVLWVDPSPSMHYSSAPKKQVSKYEYAFTLACTLAYVLTESGERVTTTTQNFSATHAKDVPRLAEMLLQDSVDNSFDRLKNAQIFLFSDFLDTDIERLKGIQKICHARQNNLDVIVPIDPNEKTYPFNGHLRFEDMTASKSFETQNAKNLKTEYLDRLKKHHEAIKLIAGQRQTNIIGTYQKYEVTALNILRSLI